MNGENNNKNLCAVFKKSGKLEETLKQIGVEGKLRYSAKAGCKCGCSPGYIVEGHSNKNVFITISPDLKLVVNN